MFQVSQEACSGTVEALQLVDEVAPVLLVSGACIGTVVFARNVP
jgi:hypothetical protein